MRSNYPAVPIEYKLELNGDVVGEILKDVLTPTTNKITELTNEVKELKEQVNNLINLLETR